MSEHLNVVVSSTVLDLPSHRKAVMDACLQQNMFPIMMEYLPSSDTDAIQASIDLVNRADIYIGVFAYRYGHVPVGHSQSITEMEYKRAAARGLPCLVFLIDREHAVLAQDVDKGEKAKLLEAFKERLKAEKIVSYFRSPENLHSHVLNSLSEYRHTAILANNAKQIRDWAREYGIEGEAKKALYGIVDSGFIRTREGEK